MAQTAHTPGAWYAMTAETGGLLDQANVFSEHETDGEPTFIADTLSIDDEVPLEQRKANARLIAAAPELLAVCQALESHCRVETLETRGNPAAHAAEGKLLRVQMRAAIALATGAAS